MSSFIFDSFKKRYLTSNVPQSDKWYFIPVNSSFKDTYETDDIKLYHYRNIHDFQEANRTYFNFSISDEAKKYNNLLTQKYYVKGKKGINLDDKKNWSPTAIGGLGLLEGNKINRTWSKVMDDDTLSNKPMFINSANSATFMNSYSADIQNNFEVGNYLVSGGFYYIRSKDELTWFANRSNNGNNKIIGVLGDNIEGVINGDPIGKDESNPFQGILDGNGFTLKNITIDCNSTDNGLVGVLGKNGVVRNFNIENPDSVNNLNCRKAINLKHIKEDARDINAGILVGRNYGRIQNINALKLQNFNFYGFVPEVYSVTNKSDDYSWTDSQIRKKFDNSNSNYYYLNSFCINSPGNVCPYVGYFAEGYYGEDKYTIARVLFGMSGNSAKPYMVADDNSFVQAFITDGSNITRKIWSINGHDILKLNGDNLTGFNYNVLNNACYTQSGYYLNNLDYSDFNVASGYVFDSGNDAIRNMATQLSQLSVYYGVDNKGYYTCGICTNTSASPPNMHSVSISASTICYNTNIIQSTLGIENDAPSSEFINIICPSAYCQTSLRMNSLARAAYNVGIIAGANYGSITNVSINTTAKNTSNFVGFFGTIAGKQSNGNIDSVEVNVNNQFEYSGADNSYNVVYKNTPILPQSLKNKFSNYVIGTDVYPSSNLDILFSSFYDTDSGVNTATDIKNDCITYKLKPIIIAGGLFGRYVPTWVSECRAGETTLSNDPVTVNNAHVIYSDNYESTNCSGNYKRIENAMGIIAGKVDFGNQSIGILEDRIAAHNAMYINNSEFSAITPTGPRYPVHPFSSDGSDIGWCCSGTEPITTTCDRKYVGVYELKYNVLESMAIAFDEKDKIPSASGIKAGKDTGYLYTCDYPFKISGTEDTDASFYINHYLYDNLSPECSGNLGTNIPRGLNKCNISQELIYLNNVQTNISPIMLVYDDFVTTWVNDDNSMQQSADINRKAKIPTSKKAWYQVSDDQISSYWGDVYKNTSNTAIPAQTGIAEVDFSEIAGIQNIFDGYTFIRYKQNGAYGQNNVFANGGTDNPENYECWFTDDSAKNYNNPRIFEKNISPYSSPYLCPVNYSDIEKKSYTFNNSIDNITTITATGPSDSMSIVGSTLINTEIFNRHRHDDYFYYTYNDTVNYYFNAKTVQIPIDQSLSQNELVNFGIYDNHLGYCTDVKEDRIPYNYSYYGIGENLSATQIRNRINLEGQFITTAISSNEAFGGLLVIDSSGNNVMFLDNTNNAPLTGNCVVYPTPLLDEGKKILLLEVK
jgi:hypothetical protein